MHHRGQDPERFQRPRSSRVPRLQPRPLPVAKTILGPRPWSSAGLPGSQDLACSENGLELERPVPIPKNHSSVFPSLQLCPVEDVMNVESEHMAFWGLTFFAAPSPWRFVQVLVCVAEEYSIPKISAPGLDQQRVRRNSPRGPEC